MLTPSQRRCKDAQNPPRNPVGKASQSVVQLPRPTVGKTLLKANLHHVLHMMGPTLAALLFAGAGSGIAHAQGTMTSPAHKR